MWLWRRRRRIEEEKEEIDVLSLHPFSPSGFWPLACLIANEGILLYYTTNLGKQPRH